ncbi:deubiquitinase DESI2-like [Asterias rubens]|uniref:deubiquitinase DESI2-like n=1 Tax=Asterias rubens TaxID=7604 RepID=UPI001455545E|nr:deubiquitinase DESI2-like [Asterias rubens]XP_033638991.1 deubiquitinase DESI2-like [Asterias rubens]
MSSGISNGDVNLHLMTEVQLNVYDMYWTNEYTSTLGLGVFHAGVEVYGKEYAFGGHPFPFTGIFEIEPRDCDDLGEQFQFKESISLGETDLPEDAVTKVIDCLGKKYPGDEYHLIRKNCNHFAQEFVQILCRRDIPSWINRLATVGARLPFMEKMLPKEWLTPLALEPSIKEPEPSRNQTSTGAASNGGNS